MMGQAAPADNAFRYLAAWRTRQGMTVQRLSELSGTPLPTMYRIESGHELPNWEQLVGISEALALPMAVLFHEPLEG